MRIHNSFTITQNGKKVIAENTVTNAGLQLKRNLAYASYIVLRGSSGSIIKKTSLVKICDDIKAGTLSATYAAELSENELAGFKIERIGFSPYEDGSETANIAEVGEIEKEFGHALDITGTIYVTLDMQGTEFVSYDNPLAGFLLGLKPLDDAFFIAPYSRQNRAEREAEENWDEERAVAVQMQKTETASGFRLVAGNVTAGSDGAAVLYKDKPVLFLPSVVSAAAKSVDKAANSYGAIKAGGRLARDISISLDGKAYSGGDTLKAIEGCDQKRDTGIRLTAGDKLITEQSGKYFAVAGESDVMLLSNECKLIRLMKKRNSGVMLTADGSVVFFGDSVIIADASGKEHNYPIACGSNTAICGSKSDGYRIMTECGGFIMRYLIEGDKTKLLGMTRTSGSPCIFRYGELLISVDGNIIDTWAKEKQDTEAEKLLAEFMLSIASPTVKAGGEGLLLAYSGSTSYAADLKCGRLLSMAGSVRLGAGVILSDSSKGTSVCVFDPGSGALKEILRPTEKITAAALCKDTLLLTDENNVLKSAKLIFGDTFVRSADFANKTVTVKSNEDTVAASPASVSVYFDF